jgi:adenosylcobinamide kinase/adenosylcobinamide-phosphate guanylyltransferase
MGRLTLLTGPTRSGKSRHAVSLAQRWGANVVFVATYRSDAHNDTHDDEMLERVRRHRAERPNWRTLEAPTDVVAELQAMRPLPSGVLIDCLTLWISDRFQRSDEDLIADWDTQLSKLRAAPWPAIIVSNELGWGLVPPDSASRRFRDLAGSLAQRTAAAADEAWLIVAGCSVQLK